MRPVALRLQHRLVIPVALVAILATALAAFVSYTLVSRALEGRVRTQLANAAEAVSRSDFALNPTILDQLKAVAAADIVTYTTDGTLLATTIGSDRAGLATAIMAEPSIASMPEGETVMLTTSCLDVPCYVAYRRVPTTPGTVVALVVDTAELAAATRGMARTIVVSAGLGFVIMLLVGRVVARRVTGPLDELVTFTRDVSAGGSLRRAETRDDEVGTLAAAFNDMLDRLERAQAALVRSEKLALAGLMAARVAHDIRNPMSSLKMQAQLLQSRVPPGDGQRMLQGILHDVEQVESVVSGLLELAKPGEAQLRPTAINEVVRQVLEHQALQFAHRKIAVSEDLAEPLPLIPLDAHRLNQALRNVVANAAEAMPSGGTLWVSTRLTVDGSEVELRVCDDGLGVAPEMIDHVFDPFVSTKREGVGLGLVNTRSIIEGHGGHVRLAPREPRGTCVTMSLPVSPAPERVAEGALHSNG